MKRETDRPPLGLVLGQQEAIANLAHWALVGMDLGDLMEKTARKVVETLEVGFVDVFELQSKDNKLVVWASIGWKPELSTQGQVSEVNPTAAHVLESDSPIVLEGPHVKNHLCRTDELKDHGIASCVYARIGPELAPFGILGVYATKKHRFAESDGHFLQAVSELLADAIARKRHEDQLKLHNERLENQIKLRTEWLTLLQDVTRAANEAENVDQVLRFVLKRTSEYDGWRFGHVCLPARDDPDVLVASSLFYSPDPARFRSFREATLERRFQRGHGLPGRVYARGKAEWTAQIDREFLPSRHEIAVESGVKSAVAFPVLIGSEVVAVIELFSDESRTPGKVLLSLMSDVGLQVGRVVERKRLQEGFAEAVWQEQQRIVQELHDGLGQELTGMVFLSKSLAQQLKEQNHPAEERADRLMRSLQQALERIRAMSKGIFPVEVHSEGLTSALNDLSESTHTMYGIPSGFQCGRRIFVTDNKTATHIYRIAQEAVINAVKHAKAKRIFISLHEDKGKVTLQVQDDGVGIAEQHERGRGMGLRIMGCRAAYIGGKLSVERVKSGGTVVKCTVKLGNSGEDDEIEGPSLK
jgi:signal transduction histidine kinase